MSKGLRKQQERRSVKIILPQSLQRRVLIDDRTCKEDIRPVSRREGGFSHPTDDDQKWDDECANLLQATSQRPVRNAAEYSYDRTTDTDPNGEFHLALGRR